MRRNGKVSLFGLGVPLAMTIGIIAGTVVNVRPVSACEKNVCSEETGNCTITDVNFNCQEIVEDPGCLSTPCTLE